jgi:hypothetical protein
VTAKELLGVRPGDIVRVKGLRGEFKVTGWREEPGGLVINLVGGSRRLCRSVTADRVTFLRDPSGPGEAA